MSDGPIKAAVLTTGRQDFGILRSTLRLMRDDPAFDLRLLVGGMHLSERFGRTVDQITQDGFEPSAYLSWLDESGPTVADQAASATRQAADALETLTPDYLMLVGDRYETAAVAFAATLQRIPIVHLHGGEETEGAIDNVLRHAVSKMAHLHFVSHDKHAARLVQMGEHPDSVHTVGAPGIDNVLRLDLADRSALEASLGLSLTPPVVIVTVHPTTLASGTAIAPIDGVLAAMRDIEATYVITLPNSDPGHAPIRQRLAHAAAKNPRAVAVEALGESQYFGLMKVADAVMGNSSSALIEAPALFLPAVNIGDRQKGRTRGDNVIDVPSDPARVIAGLARALEPDFRDTVRQTRPPFGDGRAGIRIHRILSRWCPPETPRKRFFDLSGGPTDD